MSEGVSLFWSFGTLYFKYLNDIALFGVSLVCYILGAFIITRVFSAILKIGSTVSFFKKR